MNGDSKYRIYTLHISIGQKRFQFPHVFSYMGAVMITVGVVVVQLAIESPIVWDIRHVFVM